MQTRPTTSAVCDTVLTILGLTIVVGVLVLACVSLFGCSLGPADPYSQEQFYNQQRLMAEQREELRENREENVPQHTYCFTAGNTLSCN